MINNSVTYNFTYSSCKKDSNEGRMKLIWQIVHKVFFVLLQWASSPPLSAHTN